MASSNSIVKSNQGLATMSSEELAAQTGRPMAPVSPMENGVIGGNPDQAKMAGTPGQKASAIRQGIQEERDLTTAIRRGQGRTQATGEEKAAQERLEALKGTGGLDTRVQEIAQENVDQAMANEQEIKDQQWSQDPEVQALIERVRANPNDFDAVAQLNAKYGTADAPLTGAELVAKFTSAAEAAAARLDQAVAGIVGADIDWTQMGYNSNDEVAELLGISPEEFAGMSVAQITQKIDSILQTEYGQVDALQAKLDDPNLGPAERAEARQQLREMGVVGVRKAESAAEELQDSINKAETVELFGQEVKIGDLVEDEYFKGVVNNYLTMTEEDRAKFDKDNPGFGEFIKKYEEEFKALTEDMDEGTKALAAEKTKDDTIQTRYGFDDEFMDDITNGQWSDPNRNESVQDFIDNTYPAMALLNEETSTINPEQRVALENYLKQIKEVAPDYVKELLSMDEWQLKKLGLLDPSSDAAQELLRIIDQDRAIVKVDPNNPLSVINAFDPNMDEEGFRDMIMGIKAGINMGEIPPSALSVIPGLAEMDFKKIAQWMQSQMPGSLAEAGKMKSLYTYLQDLKTANGKFQDSTLPDNIKNSFATRTALNSGDISFQNNTIEETEATINYMNQHPEKFTESGRNEATYQYQEKLRNNIEGELKAAGLPDINSLLSGIKDGTIMGEDIESVRGILSLFPQHPQQQADLVNELLGLISQAEKDKQAGVDRAQRETERQARQAEEDRRQAEYDRTHPAEAKYGERKYEKMADEGTQTSSKPVNQSKSTGNYGMGQSLSDVLAQKRLK